MQIYRWRQYIRAGVWLLYMVRQIYRLCYECDIEIDGDGSGKMDQLIGERLSESRTDVRIRPLFCALCIFMGRSIMVLFVQFSQRCQKWLFLAFLCLQSTENDAMMSSIQQGKPKGMPQGAYQAQVPNGGTLSPCGYRMTVILAQCFKFLLIQFLTISYEHTIRLGNGTINQRFHPKNYLA